MVAAISFPGGNPGDLGYWEVVFDVIPFPVYVADSSHRIICANRAMRQRVGGEAGQTCHAVIYGRDAPCDFCKMSVLEQREAGADNLVVFEHFDDRDDRWYQLRETMVSWIDGRRAKYSVAVDISALKEVQNALAEAHAELSLKTRHLAAALDGERRVMAGQRNFLALVSHEFRMPLAIIEGAAHLLGLYNHGQAEPADEVAKIKRAVRRMSDLMEVCLADDRLESAMMAQQLSDIDLSALIGECCADKRPLAGDGRLAVVVEPKVSARVDAGLLRLAISNLIDNALKYSPSDRMVGVELARDGGAIAISVTDQGAGIAADEFERIFEKFYRSPAASGVRGAGLGLFMVKRIVDLHGGRVRVESRPGEGARFTVVLPDKEMKTG